MFEQVKFRCFLASDEEGGDSIHDQQIRPRSVAQKWLEKTEKSSLLELSLCSITKKVVGPTTLTFPLENTYLQNTSSKRNFFWFSYKIFYQLNTQGKLNFFFPFNSFHFISLGNTHSHIIFPTTKWTLRELWRKTMYGEVLYWTDIYSYIVVLKIVKSNSRLLKTIP